MKKMSVKESVGVVLFGGILTFGAGLILSATVIGAIIGVPLMIVGVGMLILSPLFIYTGKVITCPSCSMKNKSLLVFNNALTCKSCKKRILVKNNTVSLVTA